MKDIDSLDDIAIEVATYRWEHDKYIDPAHATPEHYEKIKSEVVSELLELFRNSRGGDTSLQEQIEKILGVSHIKDSEPTQEVRELLQLFQPSKTTNLKYTIEFPTKESAQVFMEHIDNIDNPEIQYYLEKA